MKEHVGLLYASLLVCVAAQPGHLEPLGSNRPSDGPVRTFSRDELPTAEVFWTECVAKNQPCLFQGMAEHSSAFTKWNLQYIRDTFGSVEVKREWRKEDRDKGFPGEDGSRLTQPRRITLGEYLAVPGEEQEYYVVTIAPDSMLVDVAVPPCLLCGDRINANKNFREEGYKAMPMWLTQLQEADLWLSTHPTKSLIHYDQDQSMNCLFAGRKEWKFYDTQKYHKFMPWAEGGTFYDASDPLQTTATDHLNIDVDKVDLVKYPGWTKVRYTSAIQNKGDCMYTPFTYTHQVNAVEPTLTVAVSYMWDRREVFNPAVCSQAPKHSWIALQDFDYLWYYNGSGVIPIGYPDVAVLRRNVLKLAIKVAKNKGGLTLKRFYKEFFSDLEGCSLGETPIKERKALAEKHFNALDVAPQDRIITPTEVRSASVDIFVSLSIATDDGEEINFRLPYHGRPAGQVEAKAAAERIWSLHDHNTRTDEL